MTGDTPRERGTALIWALLFVVVTSSMVISHAIFLASNRRAREALYDRTALADLFARSGLVEGVGWFRRQPQQPVTSFAPVLDTEAETPILDTIDPSVGLVREFEIRGSLWGRYEIRKDDVNDISTERGVPTPGSVWDVPVRSYVYRVVDPSKPFDAAPNEVLAATAVTTEIRGIPLNLPATAAVCIDDRDQIKIDEGEPVRGDTGAGVAHGATDEAAKSQDGATGTPGWLELTNYDADPKRVFAMRLDELREFSDWVAGENDTPVNFDDMVIFVPQDVGDWPIKDSSNSLIIVEGDLEDSSSEMTRIRGVLYVTGDMSIDGNWDIDGAVVVRGNLKIRTKLGPVTIDYDPEVIDELRERLGEYRMRRTVKVQ